MLYSILLTFIFSCNQPSFVYRMLPKMETTSKSTQKQINSIRRFAKPIGETYSLHTAVCKTAVKWVLAILAQDNLVHEGKKDDPDMQVNRRDKHGYLPIHWAVSKNFSSTTDKKVKDNISILKLLLQYPNSNQACRDGKTVLHWAVWSRHLKAVNIILKYFKNYRKKFLHFLQQKDNDSFTALHYAVDRDEKGNYTETDLKILQTLLEYSGVHIDTQDNNGMTILHWAVANNNLEAVKAILKHAKATMPYEDYKEFVQKKTFINQQPKEGSCPAIYWAISTGYEEEEEEDIQLFRTTSLKIFNLLLHTVPIHDAYGINYQDHQGYTMAHWAVVQGRDDILQVLIKHNADLSLKDNKGYTISKTLTQAIAAAYNRKKWRLIEHLTKRDDSILNQLSSLASSKKGEQSNKRPSSEKERPFKKRLHLEQFE